MTPNASMLTSEKLRTYDFFGGDIDGWARMSKGRGPSTMLDEDWYLIDDLLMGLDAVASGMASERFAQELRGRIAAATENDLVRAELVSLAQRMRKEK